MKRREKEYDKIYSDNMWDEDEDPDDVIDRMKGTISSGSCVYCGASDGMIFEGNCFICKECGKSVHEDTYYMWAAGYDVNTDDDYDDTW